jgi:transposase
VVRRREEQRQEAVHRRRHLGPAHRGRRARRERARPCRCQDHPALGVPDQPIRFGFADGGYAGKLVDWACTILATVVHVVRKPEGQHGFAVTPRRWRVERALARLTAHSRLARDYERDPASSEAMIRWAAINTMTSRIAEVNPPHGNNAGNGSTNHDRVSNTRYEDAQFRQGAIDKKLFYVKTDFRHERRRLPRPDRAG